jgi:hypothetical protein
MSANSEHHDDTPPSGVTASRRKLLQAGLGAAPVILTLTSKPAFAQTADRSAIESMSTCMSLTLPECQAGSSITTLKSYYQPTPSNTELKDLEAAATTDGVTLASTSDTSTFLDTYSGPTFSSIFGTIWGPQTGRLKWKGDERFGDVLWMASDADPQNFGKLLVAAYLNASNGDYPLTLTQVVTMGQRSLAGLPYYLSETSSISWDQSQVIKYLTNTIAL